MELDEDQVREIARAMVEDMLQDLRLEAEIVEGQVSISLTIPRYLYGRSVGRGEICSTTLPLPKTSG